MSWQTAAQILEAFLIPPFPPSGARFRAARSALFGAAQQTLDGEGALKDGHAEGKAINLSHYDVRIPEISGRT